MVYKNSIRLFLVCTEFELLIDSFYLLIKPISVILRHQFLMREIKIKT